MKPFVKEPAPRNTDSNTIAGSERFAMERPSAAGMFKLKEDKGPPVQGAGQNGAELVIAAGSQLAVPENAAPAWMTPTLEAHVPENDRETTLA